MKTININTARRLVKKYADARPTHQAQSRYTQFDNQNVPECIVGQVLINDLGVPGEDVSETYACASQILGERLPDVKVSANAEAWLDSVQRFQDGRARQEECAAAGVDWNALSREPWGRAVELADAAYAAGYRSVDKN